jgi:aminopeptidase N
MDPERTPEAKRPEPDDWKKVTKTAFGTGGHTTMTARVKLPADYRANMPGVCTSDTVDGAIRTMEWKSDHPIMAVNLVAGKWQESKGERTAIWHLPAHSFNIPAMLEALDGAHEWYSKWFWPYPWKELRISEFPGLAGYAQGFPSNIVFSESIGFLSKPSAEQDAPFMIVAHETAHQWWGNILPPGDAPGGNILSEGMANFSTARLFRQLRGDRARQAFMREIEFSYTTDRSVDEERPMTEIDGNRRGDTTVTYDKGGWVFWMLMEHLGDDKMDEGLRAFIGKFKDGPDYPLLQDFIADMRPFAKDPAAYDAFIDQWFLSVIIPEIKVKSALCSPPAKEGDPWRTVVTVQNAGTGTVAIEMAVTNGEDRWPQASLPRTAEERAAAAKQRDEYKDARGTCTIAAGATAEYVIESPFKPKKVIADPDVHILMIGRKVAEADIAEAVAASSSIDQSSVIAPHDP